MRNGQNVTRQWSTSTERGQVALLFALMLSVLLGIAALAIDGGNVFLVRRQLQSTADLSALAGARTLYNESAANAISEATAYAALNGSPTATVNVPPASGAHLGDDAYVEVITQRVTNTFFAGILGVAQVNVQARAVARSGRDVPPYALLALSTSASPGISFGGSGNVKINNAGMMSNSGMDPSITQQSQSNPVQSDGPVNAVGTIIGTYVAPSVTSGVPPYPDPLEDMPPPTFGSPGTDAPTTRHGIKTNPDRLVLPSSGVPLPGSVTSCPGADSYTFCPGVYWGGIQMAGGAYTMAPGIYVIAGGGFAITGGSLSGGTPDGANGIFIYNTNDPRPTGGNYGGAMGDYGPININANQPVTLYASHTPLYPGMAGNVLIYQDRNSTDVQDAMALQANGSTNLYGTIYLPGVGINIAGGGSSGVANGQVIVNTASFTGGNTSGITYSSDWAIVPHGATLAE